MPELPEVEHIVRALSCSIAGSRIMATEFRARPILGNTATSTFSRNLKNARIEAVSRRGKYILVHLDSGRVLLAHLRMTGKFVCLSPEKALPLYAHVILYLDDDRRLVFCDMRKFGRLRILPASDLNQSPELINLAPEPFADEFSIEHFKAILRRSNRSLKTLLLDQTKVVGLGNIYASEALFMARINPLAFANSLSGKRVVRLHQAIREVLQKAIDCGSTLKIDLEDGNGNYFGSAERFWRVYEREDEPCATCGARIRRVVQAGRSTYFCPRCQRR